MNQVTLTGRLTRDAELKSIGVNNTPKLSFSLAVERNYQKDKNNKVVDYIDIELLGNRANSLAQYLTKGKSLLVLGELNIDKYQDKEGNTRYATKVKADRIEFLSSSNTNQNSDIKEAKKDDSYENYLKQVQNAPDLEPIDDDDIPF